MEPTSKESGEPIQVRRTEMGDRQVSYFPLLLERRVLVDEGYQKYLNFERGASLSWIEELLDAPSRLSSVMTPEYEMI